MVGMSLVESTPGCVHGCLVHWCMCDECNFEVVRPAV